MPPKTPTKPAIEARRAKVADLLLAGASYRKISAITGANLAAVTADVRFLLAMWAEQQNPEARHHWRALEIEKLGEIEILNLRRAKDGDTKAIDSALRIMERRAKLLGLDAPTRVNVNEQEVRAEVESLLRQLASGEEY